jgi:uncharacterized protein YeaO (DUF488 family)
MPGKPTRRPLEQSVRVDIARVYDEVEPDRYRVLVDRLWPRGVSRAAGRFDVWLKDIAPSTELRRWYGHEPEKFPEFSRRYREELAQLPARAVLDQLRDQAAAHDVLLVTATHDVGRSAAAVLRDVLGGR